MARKPPSRKYSRPVELTEEEVRAAREGRGTHALPERHAGRKPTAASRTRKTKRPEA